MNLATAPGALAIAGYCNLFNGATLSLYSGSIPATPETAASGTLLYTFTFASPAFSTLSTTGGYDSLSATFTGAGTYQAAGTAGYARATIATPSAWASTHAYTRGTLVTASSNLYVMTAATGTSGSTGPSGTGYGFVDGGAIWDYVGASTVTALADYTVGTSGTDIVLGTTTIISGVSVTITSFLIRVATV